MDITSNQVIAIATSLSTLGVGFVAWQAFTLVRQLRADHERSRREKANAMLELWDRSLTRKGSLARKFAENLDFDQSRTLFNQDEFSVQNKYEDQLKAIIGKDNYAEEDGYLNIGQAGSAELRWQIVTYLNSLETILSSWHHSIADKDMIEEQFRYLVSPEKGHYILSSFRDAAGGINTFPCIAAFVEHLKSKNNSSNGKRPVV